MYFLLMKNKFTNFSKSQNFKILIALSSKFSSMKTSFFFRVQDDGHSTNDYIHILVQRRKKEKTVKRYFPECVNIISIYVSGQTFVT